MGWRINYLGPSVEAPLVPRRTVARNHLLFYPIYVTFSIVIEARFQTRYPRSTAAYVGGETLECSGRTTYAMVLATSLAGFQATAKSIWRGKALSLPSQD